MLLKYTGLLMPDTCTVLIAAADQLPVLKQKTTGLDGELLAFTDTDALLALEVITKRRPPIIVLERTFAATPRGTALINRIKADPTLESSEIRVMAPDSDAVRVLPRTPPAGGAKPAPAR